MGTIVMEAAKVIEAANAKIAYINVEREKRNAKMISNEIENSIPGRIRKLLGCKSLTSDQAIKNLCNVMFGPYPSRYAWGDLQKAEDLKRLAQHGDPVTLDQNDVRVLF